MKKHNCACGCKEKSKCQCGSTTKTSKTKTKTKSSFSKGSGSRQLKASHHALGTDANPLKVEFAHKSNDYDVGLNTRFGQNPYRNVLGNFQNPTLAPLNPLAEEIQQNFIVPQIGGYTVTEPDDDDEQNLLGYDPSFNLNNRINNYDVPRAFRYDMLDNLMNNNILAGLTLDQIQYREMPIYKPLDNFLQPTQENQLVPYVLNVEMLLDEDDEKMTENEQPVVAETEEEIKHKDEEREPFPSYDDFDRSSRFNMTLKESNYYVDVMKELRQEIKKNKLKGDDLKDFLRTQVTYISNEIRMEDEIKFNKRSNDNLKELYGKILVYKKRNNF